ncbi:MAG: Rne/Rng family ribonuclease [Gammaproteobacteria bacterium]
MLINATQKEELRVAIVEGNILCDLDIERRGRAQKKANIYKGRVSRVEPSLEAAFVDYGSDRHGFLPIKEIAPQYFSQDANSDRGRPKIRDALKPGQEVIVQVDKEERGTKGAALTTYIGLAGCYLVLMPNNPRAGGISRRIEGDDRSELRDTLNQLNIPEGMGLIIRTAGLGRNIEELQWDLSVLLTQWNAIQEAADSRQAPFLIHQESDVVARAVRDHLRPDIDEIWVDDPETFERAKNHVETVRPDFVSRIKLYQDSVPLFNRHKIESQIESAFVRKVALENGGSIVIDHTEALTAIDINSARATEGGDIEETAYKTNLAAAKEIARQLRLRDLGGLIVIDFIDMSSIKNQRSVENFLRDELKHDRARIQIGRISRFGLLEMSRQRLRPALGDATLVTCSKCEGQGTIRGMQSLALAILRVIEEAAMKDATIQVRAELPVEMATYLFNEKRPALVEIEKRHEIQVVLIPNSHLTTPHYEIETINESDTQAQAIQSYELANRPKRREIEERDRLDETKMDEPAIKTLPSQAPPSRSARDSGLIKRLWSAVFGATPGSETSVSRESDNTPTTQARNTAARQNSEDQNTQGDRDPRRQGQQTRRPQQGRGNRNNNNRNQQNPRRRSNPKDRQEQGNRRREHGETEQRQSHQPIEARERPQQAPRRESHQQQRNQSPSPEAAPIQAVPSEPRVIEQLVKQPILAKPVEKSIEKQPKPQRNWTAFEAKHQSNLNANQVKLEAHDHHSQLASHSPLHEVKTTAPTRVVASEAISPTFVSAKVPPSERQMVSSPEPRSHIPSTPLKQVVTKSTAREIHRENVHGDSHH